MVRACAYMCVHSVHGEYDDAGGRATTEVPAPRRVYAMVMVSPTRLAT